MNEEENLKGRNHRKKRNDPRKSGRNEKEI